MSTDNTQTPETQGVQDAEIETLETALDLSTESHKETVGLDKFLTEKNARKQAEERAQIESDKASQLEREIAQLRSNSVAMNVGQVNEELVAMAERYDADPQLLSELYTSLEKKLDSKLAPKIQAMEEERRRENGEKKFAEIFDKTMNDMPEYTGIINKDVIKALAFSPLNAKKTLAQIVEETYGNAISGRKTLETSSGHVRKESNEVNLKNPSMDDFDRINADPALKEQWSKTTMDEVAKYL